MARRPSVGSRARGGARRAPAAACAHGGGAARGGLPPAHCPQCLGDLAQAAHGVAHALNNAISVCAGNLELLRDELPQAAQRAMLDDAQAALGGLERLVGGFTAIAHRQPYAATRVEPRAFLAARAAGWRARLRAGWRLELALPARGALPALAVDPDYLALALQALIANATAVAAAAGTVRVGCALRRGQVIFEVADDGPAIDTAHRARAFAPGHALRPGAVAGVGLWFVGLFAAVAGGRVRVAHNAADAVRIALALPLAAARAAARR